VRAPFKRCCRSENSDSCQLLTQISCWSENLEWQKFLNAIFCSLLKLAKSENIIVGLDNLLLIIVVTKEQSNNYQTYIKMH
jgi:hypothetical protein